MEEKKVLVIVDFQRDFCDKNGALYVPGAEEALKNILKYIDEHKDAIDKIVFTLDWHRHNDKSFSENGGQWPVHCLQNTEGARIPCELRDKVYEYDIPNVSIRKGDVPDHEEYGAFERVEIVDPKHIICRSYKGSDDIVFDDEHTYVLCGLAGDYCVWETFKNMMKAGLRIHVFNEGISFIGDEFGYFERYHNEMGQGQTKNTEK